MVGGLCNSCSVVKDSRPQTWEGPRLDRRVGPLDDKKRPEASGTVFTGGRAGLMVVRTSSILQHPGSGMVVHASTIAALHTCSM